jgi:acyl-CoA thioesterase-1
MNKKELMLLTIGLAILVATSGVASLYMSSVGGQEDKIRVACVGDSITGGTNYPDDLWMLLGENFTVGNFGVPGSTASVDSENPYINNVESQDAKHFQPNIVVIMLGTNDANSQIKPNNGSFVSDYVRLVETFQSLPTKPQVYLVKPPPVFCNGTTPSAEYLGSTVIPTIEQAAQETNVPIIDVNSALANNSNLFPDGVHPNSEGANLIAYEVYRAIT